MNGHASFKQFLHEFLSCFHICRFFNGKPDNKKTPIVAHANVIKYYPANGDLILIGNGEIHNNGNTLRGPMIKYDANKEVLISTPTKQKRIVIVIQPQH